MDQKTFSYESERTYYSQQWPTEARPYDNLEPYFRCWLQPEEVFGEKRVLDIGAGECTYTRLIADKFKPTEIVACELFQERMLPAAMNNTNSNLKFIAGHALCLPFRSGSFDVIWGSGVLSQIPNLPHVLSEIQRVLKKKGLYTGWEPNPFNAVIAYRYFFKSHSPNHYLFWPWRIRPAFERAGFEVRFQYYYAKFPWLRNRFFGTCLGILARLKDKQI